MTTVFISGSRKIARLSEEVKGRLSNILDNNFHVVVGDADGADKAVQTYLSELKYEKVAVFCSGNTCRNNIGHWDVKRISVDSKTGRDFYTQKDKEMAIKSDYGFIIWDGKSPGSFNNIIELLKNDKKALVYFSPEKNFHTITDLSGAKKLLNKCEDESVKTIKKKIKLHSSVREIQGMAQDSLAL